MRGCPAGQVELGVTGLVAGAGAVALLAQHVATRPHQDRAERLVAPVERLAGEVDAATEVREVVVGQVGRRHPPTLGRTGRVVERHRGVAAPVLGSDA